MENAVQALKIAFAVMMFALALTISMSSFSSAKTSIDNIIMMKDKKTEYTYIEPGENIVGIETIIPTLYRAYYEDFKVVFLDSSGKPMPLYYALDAYGKVKTDEKGKQVTVNTIDLEEETHQNKAELLKFLIALLGNKTDAEQKYKNAFKYEEGLYKYLSTKKFEEHLGEYYQEDALAGTETDALEVNKKKKRIITYKLVT